MSRESKASPLLLGAGAARETGADPNFSPAALIFDCDGTVLDTMEWYYPSWEETCKNHGIAISRAKFYSCAGIPVREIFAKLVAEQKLEGTVDIDELLAEKHAIVEAQRKVSVPGVTIVCEIVKHNHGKAPMAIASSGIKAGGLKENECCSTLMRSSPRGCSSGKTGCFFSWLQTVSTPSAGLRFEDADVGMESLRAAGMDAIDVRKMINYPHKFDLA